MLKRGTECGPEGCPSATRSVRVVVGIMLIVTFSAAATASAAAGSTYKGGGKAALKDAVTLVASAKQVVSYNLSIETLCGKVGVGATQTVVWPVTPNAGEAPLKVKRSGSFAGRQHESTTVPAIAGVTTEPAPGTYTLLISGRFNKTRTRVEGHLSLKIETSTGLLLLGQQQPVRGQEELSPAASGRPAGAQGLGERPCSHDGFRSLGGWSARIPVRRVTGTGGRVGMLVAAIGGAPVGPADCATRKGGQRSPSSHRPTRPPARSRRESRPSGATRSRRMPRPTVGLPCSTSPRRWLPTLLCRSPCTWRLKSHICWPWPSLSPRLRFSCARSSSSTTAPTARSCHPSAPTHGLGWGSGCWSTRRSFVGARSCGPPRDLRATSSGGEGRHPHLTVAEYRALPPRGRLAYRLSRNPLLMFGVGPIIAMMIGPRIVARGARPRMRRSVLATNVALALLIGALCLLIGWRDYLLVPGAGAHAGRLDRHLAVLRTAPVRGRLLGGPGRNGATPTPRSEAAPT